MTNDIDVIVAGIAFEIFPAVLEAVGRIGGDNIMQALCLSQIIYRKAPNLLVFIRRAPLGAPPEPVAIVLVKWSKNNWDRFAFGTLQIREKCRDLIQLFDESFVILTPPAARCL
jgi:hypothetical protein